MLTYVPAIDPRHDLISNFRIGLEVGTNQELHRVDARGNLMV